MRLLTATGLQSPAWNLSKGEFLQADFGLKVHEGIQQAEDRCNVRVDFGFLT